MLLLLAVFELDLCDCLGKERSAKKLFRLYDLGSVAEPINVEFFPFFIVKILLASLRRARNHT